MPGYHFPGNPAHFSRQPGCLDSRPVAFRPHLTIGLAFSKIKFRLSINHIIFHRNRGIDILIVFNIDAFVKKQNFAQRRKALKDIYNNVSNLSLCSLRAL